MLTASIILSDFYVFFFPSKLVLIPVGGSNSCNLGVLADLNEVIQDSLIHSICTLENIWTGDVCLLKE